MRTMFVNTAQYTRTTILVFASYLINTHTPYLKFSNFGQPMYWRKKITVHNSYWYCSFWFSIRGVQRRWAESEKNWLRIGFRLRSED